MGQSVAETETPVDMPEPQAQKDSLARDPGGPSGAANAETPVPPKRPTLWEILNSQLVLWLLGSVVLSGITFYWNNRNDQRSNLAKQAQEIRDKAQADEQKKIDRKREDSQFLGTMIPYLTSSIADVRLRAVQVIAARYDGPLPSDVSQIVGKAVGQDLAPGQSQQSPETRNLAANVSSQLPARIYLQIFGEGGRAKAKEIQSLLRDQGWLVPGIENVAGKAAPVTKTFVRYFNDSDTITADRVHDTLVHNGFSQTSVEKSTLKANPGTIEVWFGATS